VAWSWMFLVRGTTGRRTNDLELASWSVHILERAANKNQMGMILKFAAVYMYVLGIYISPVVSGLSRLHSTRTESQKCPFLHILHRITLIVNLLRSSDIGKIDSFEDP
jgi:hypothetical protein